MCTDCPLLSEFKICSDFHTWLDFRTGWSFVRDKALNNLTFLGAWRSKHTGKPSTVLCSLTFESVSFRSVRRLCALLCGKAMRNCRPQPWLPLRVMECSDTCVKIGRKLHSKCEIYEILVPHPPPYFSPTPISRFGGGGNSYAWVFSHKGSQGCGRQLRMAFPHKSKVFSRFWS